VTEIANLPLDFTAKVGIETQARDFEYVKIEYVR